MVRNKRPAPAAPTSPAAAGSRPPAPPVGAGTPPRTPGRQKGRAPPPPGPAMAAATEKPVGSGGRPLFRLGPYEPRGGSARADDAADAGSLGVDSEGSSTDAGVCLDDSASDASHDSLAASDSAVGSPAPRSPGPGSPATTAARQQTPVSAETEAATAVTEPKPMVQTLATTEKVAGAKTVTTIGAREEEDVKTVVEGVSSVFLSPEQSVSAAAVPPPPPPPPPPSPPPPPADKPQVASVTAAEEETASPPRRVSSSVFLSPEQPALLSSEQAPAQREELKGPVSVTQSPQSEAGQEAAVLTKSAERHVSKTEIKPQEPELSPSLAQQPDESKSSQSVSKTLILNLEPKSQSPPPEPKLPSSPQKPKAPAPPAPPKPPAQTPSPKPPAPPPPPKPQAKSPSPPPPSATPSPPRAPTIVQRTYAERQRRALTLPPLPEGGFQFHLREKDAARSASIPEAAPGDGFAGRRDFLTPADAIRSGRGTVRGVRDRVRAGIATFLHDNPAARALQLREQDRVVVYVTTMGIVRPTYQQCLRVRQILRQLMVEFEERDLFLSVATQEELCARLGTDTVQPPQVFVDGQLIGGAEAVERLNESGELRRMMRPYKTTSPPSSCAKCGGFRMLPCTSCNGSKKSWHRNHFSGEWVVMRCGSCDQSGLLRCDQCARS